MKSGFWHEPGSKLGTFEVLVCRNKNKINKNTALNIQTLEQYKCGLY